MDPRVTLAISLVGMVIAVLACVNTVHSALVYHRDYVPTQAIMRDALAAGDLRVVARLNLLQNIIIARCFDPLWFLPGRLHDLYVKHTGGTEA